MIGELKIRGESVFGKTGFKKLIFSNPILIDGDVLVHRGTRHRFSNYIRFHEHVILKETMTSITITDFETANSKDHAKETQKTNRTHYQRFVKKFAPVPNVDLTKFDEMIVFDTNGFETINRKMKLSRYPLYELAFRGGKAQFVITKKPTDEDRSLYIALPGVDCKVTHWNKKLALDLFENKTTKLLFLKTDSAWVANNRN